MHPTSELILRFCRSEPCSRPATTLLINPPRDLLAIKLDSALSLLAEPPQAVFPESREARLLESSLTPPKVPMPWIPDVCGAKSGMTGRVAIFTQDFGDASWLQQSGITCEFGLLPQAGTANQIPRQPPVQTSNQTAIQPPEQTPVQTSGQTQSLTLAGIVILFLPREKERLEFLLHFIATHLPADGRLWLVGENKAGIKSAETRLQQRFSKVQKRDSARHCVLYVAQEPKTREPAANATGASKEEPLWETVANRPGDEAQVQTSDAAADLTGASKEEPLWERALPATNPSKDRQLNELKPFSPDDYLQEWALPTKAGEIRLQSLPGAFAHGRLDKGTALLLDYLQSADSRQLKIKGKVLDFGCGSGVIGIYLKRQYPDIALEMLDTSAVALESARLSLQLNACEAQLTASDGLDQAKGRYDWIISNPPFHKGVATDFEIARRFISKAPAKLGNRGRMLLVCNRHLPYESWLSEAFVGFEKVAENREFKVLQAHGPRRLK